MELNGLRVSIGLDSNHKPVRVLSLVQIQCLMSNYKVMDEIIAPSKEEEDWYNSLTEEEKSSMFG